MPFQSIALKHHFQAEDNLYGYHDFIVQCKETFHVERTVTPRTGHALTSKSLPEIQQRHQVLCVIDSCPREQRFAVAFTTKRSLKKMSV